ncbi:MAG: 4-hydroxy-tetrahydrodipicolinate reductase [Bacteroidota bacterium]
MNIAIIGNGRMGVEIQKAAAERKITVSKIFTLEHSVNSDELKGVDICIDFSLPESVIKNIEVSAKAGKNIVVGTTGWHDKLSTVKNIVDERRIGLLYSSNFSIGMNIFFRIVTEAAKYFNDHEMYDAAISEIHHTGKKDSPSGTALTLGELILKHLPRKKRMLSDTSRGGISPEQLHITSTRTGSVVGTHRVIFDSEADTIELTHTAKNRSGFALGALLAAEWLIGKQGLFTMEDIFR